MELSIKEIRNIGEILQQKAGVDLNAYSATSCRMRLTKALNNLNLKNHDDFLQKIAHPPFIDALLTQMIVPETELFRDVAVWRKLKKELLPKLLKNEPLKITLIGVSTGEELFTLLIVLKQLNALGKVELTLTEITQNAIDQLKTKTFLNKEMEISIKNFERFELGGKLSDYFDQKEGAWQLKKELWINFNTVVSDLNNLALKDKVDVIWCRNQLLYYTIPAKELILNNLDAKLKTGGLIILGVKEKLTSALNKKYQELFEDESIFLKK